MFIKFAVEKNLNLLLCFLYMFQWVGLLAENCLKTWIQDFHEYNTFIAAVEQQEARFHSIN